MRLSLLALAVLAAGVAAGSQAQETPAPEFKVLPPPAMLPVPPAAPATTVAPTTIAPSTTPANPAAPAAEAPTASLDQVLAGDWRSAANKARDRYRHPRETLAFFGVSPDQHVIEIWPGGGWYAEVLAPLVRARGSYVGVVPDPAKAADAKAAASAASNNQKLRERFAAQPEVFGPARLLEVDSASPVLGAPGSADVVLTFRNAHNWVMDGNEQVMFKAFFAVLRPGGTLGVVDHRAAADQPPAEMKTSGYLPEAYVIALAEGAGFKLVGKSEINANPKDTKDYPDGVWTLPPRLAKGDVDRDKYLAIGESDRMTLRFKKPA
jgi:predicted methyltransferase